MIISKEQAIRILAFDPVEPRPYLLRIFKLLPEGAWQFWADYDPHFDTIPDAHPDHIKVLAVQGFNTPNGLALLETYCYNHAQK